jgi:predicted xylose isomerase-like sugar epimerase
MQTLRPFVAVPLMMFMALSTPALAQQRHAVSPAAIAGAVDQHVVKQDADRAAIRQALARPEVQNLAKQMGVDLGRANAAVSTLNGADLERTASAARDVNDALTGGASTIVISTTTIIIVLLVLVLLVVLLK